jgi:predicted nucleotidyltransferase
LNSLEVRYLKINFDETLSRLRAYADSKAKEQGARAIVLTGSLARGSYTGTSDADILVIADKVPANVLERYALFSDPNLPIDLEPRVYTTDEFIRKLGEGDRFALEALEVGIPLYGERFFSSLRESGSRQDDESPGVGTLCSPRLPQRANRFYSLLYFGLKGSPAPCWTRSCTGPIAVYQNESNATSCCIRYTRPTVRQASKISM